MIKFFRKIRQSLIMQNKTSKPALPAGRYFKYAIGEIILVVIGILIALSINNWNEHRLEQIQEREILKSLQYDLREDITEIDSQLVLKNLWIKNYTNCLQILTNKKEATKSEFINDFKSILQVGGVTLNTTTFNNLQTTGQIRLVRNSNLSDKIVSYYNSDLVGWETAYKDYARNTIAPYLFSFDYLEPVKLRTYSDQLYTTASNIDSDELPEKTLKAYKQDYFIINALRQRLFNLEGLALKYKDLLVNAKILDLDIQNYLDMQ
jgi:hypothetical protein